MVRVKASELKKGINTVLCKGKWAIGQGIKNHSLGNEILLSCSNNNLNINNANNGTFVWYKMAATGNAIPRITVEADKLLKYILNGAVISLDYSDKNNLLTITRDTGASATIPTLDRHPHVDAILRVSKTLHGNFETKEGMKISDKTTLTSILELDSKKFLEATKLCESVGSGIYKIDIGENKLTISSEKDREIYSEAITVAEDKQSNTAVVQYTGPFHKFFKGTLKIATNDNKPILFKTSNIVILRAPRLDA
jgi:hypothetical protein